MTIFTAIQLKNWRQFEAIAIDFHPRLTVITGSNGAGKSTILNICSQHFGYSRPYLSTPKQTKGGGLAYDLGYHRPISRIGLEFKEDVVEEQDANYEFSPDLDPKVEDNDILSYFETSPPGQVEFVEIGSVSYDNGMCSPIGFHEQQTQAYGLQINNQQHVLGVAIGSHRTMATYQPVQGLSLQLTTLANAYQTLLSESIHRLNGGQSQYSAMYRMKEALITMAAFGEGNQHLEPNEGLSAAFDGFSAVLRKALPKEIGFSKLIIRIPDIVLKTKSGEFILDSSSGGVTAVIEIAWQLYLYSLITPSFVATLDEPENHLHPSMQRSILANLLEAFPTFSSSSPRIAPSLCQPLKNHQFML